MANPKKNRIDRQTERVTTTTTTERVWLSMDIHPTPSDAHTESFSFHRDSKKALLHPQLGGHLLPGRKFHDGPTGRP